MLLKSIMVRKYFVRRWLLSILSVVSVLFGNAQEKEGNVPGVDSLQTRIAAFGRSLPQEKVYLHLDNTCYFLGDTIWYKGYVTQTNTGQLTGLSSILYVELLTPDGYLVERQQLEMKDGAANGAFVLVDSLYAGYYELRAYTRWMLNFGQYDHQHSLWIEDAFYDKDMLEEFFRDYDKLYSRVFPVYNRPEQPGEYFKDMTVRPMRRYFKAKNGKPEIDLRFYPEGGYLVAGTSCRLAFELNTNDGEHIEGVDIKIVDKASKTVTEVKSGNRGRGQFVLPLVSDAGRYKALFSYKGYDYEVDLPKAEEEGIALKINQTASVLQVEMQKSPLLASFPGGLAMQVMHQGMLKVQKNVSFDVTDKCFIEIPLSDLPTGVNQVTVFDGNRRIYADRLCFVNHHDYDMGRVDILGVEQQYEPYAPITLKLKMDAPTDSSTQVSLAVRDRATEDPLYDNGTILTEMLLSSELKGFVENPGYYFEASDSLHRSDLDLLMMVQGWRRYDWRQMSGEVPFVLRHLPERYQTFSGSVHNTYSLYEDNFFGDSVFIYALNPYSPIDFYTTAYKATTSEIKTLQDLYHIYISKLKKEVNVYTSFAQGVNTMELMQKTQNGRFCIQTPKLYEYCVLNAMATDAKDPEADVQKKMKKGFLDETEYPDFYVKADVFYPRFPKPYSFYQDNLMALSLDETDGMTTSFNDRQLPTVVVQNRRGGLRKVNLDKPAVVVDAYDIFNLAADYGLNGGMHDWRTFSLQIAIALVADMGLDRHYFIQERFDGRPLNLKANLNVQTTGDSEGTAVTAPGFSFSRTVLKDYQLLRNLDKIYVYTDYAPREEGSEKYDQSNQPEVIIDYRRFPGEAQQYTYRDRHYLLRGYAVCSDFYSPDYSRRQLPAQKDTRRTLLWMPQVEFDENGEATVELYNNGKQTAISVDVQGMNVDGSFIVGHE